MDNSAEEYTVSIDNWRRNREERLRGPHGWLATAGLFWLKPGENRMGSGSANPVRLLPGSGPGFAAIFTRHGAEIELTAAPGVEIRLDGQPLSSARLEILDETSARIELDDLHIFVIQRGDRFGVRIFDPRNPALQAFPGLEWFPVDEAFRLPARFLPFSEPRTLQILDILGDLNDMLSPGWVEFELGGEVRRLEPVLQEDGRLWFMFADRTNGALTYPAGRYLVADAPVNEALVLDFNKAYNPPCAYTPFATCPLPPPANRMPIEVCAGEKKFIR